MDHTSATGSQRHFLAMLFVDLCGSTGLSASVEVEHYVDTVDGRLLNVYLTVIARHQGQVIRQFGDGILAVFGYPEATEDAGRRATEAALEVHAQARDLGLTLHSGIHAGLALVTGGGPLTGTLHIQGEAVNIAGKLSSAARPGEVLVSEATLGPDSGLFSIASKRTLNIQGVGAPLVALSIASRAPHGSRFDARASRGLSPFVGREDLLQQLTAALDQASVGRARSIALVATAGMGKTRLANRFVERCMGSGIAVVRGYCESYLGAEPLQPFQQMVRALPAGVAGASSEDNGSGGQVAQHAAKWHPQAFVDLFAQLARRAPMVMFIDDWQWADDGSHQVLDALTRLDAPLLVLLAVRGDVDVTLPQLVTPLEVLPLSETDAETTVKRWLPYAHPFRVRDICAYAGGNPLYLEELCHRAAGGGEVQPGVGVHAGDHWLEAMIASRVARLPKLERDVVQSASVIGHTIPVWLFERVTGCRADDPRVRRLAEEDLIFPGDDEDMLRFKHRITRDAVYEVVGLADRKRLHLETAKALQARSPDVAEAREALAYHFGAAGELQQAAEYAELAGDRAMSVSALDRAKSQYMAALGALDRLGPSPSIVKRFGSVSQRLGLASVFDPTRDELPLFERAVELSQVSGNPALKAQTRYWLGYIHYALGDAPASLRELEQARRDIASCEAACLEKGETLHPAVQMMSVQIDATLGQALASAGRYRDALKALGAAIAIKRSNRSGKGDAVGLTYSLTCKGYALADQGAFEEAERCFEEALNKTGCQKLEVVGSVRGWYAAMRIWQGRYAEAMQLASEAARDGDRVRSLHLMAMGRAVAAYALWCDSGKPEALDDLRQAVDWLSRRGNALFASLNHGWLADALATAGDVAGARMHAAQALRRARRSDLLGASLACRSMCLQSARLGQLNRAARYLDKARHWASVDRQSRREQAENTICAAELALICEQRDRAMALLAEVDGELESLGMQAQRVKVRRLQREVESRSTHEALPTPKTTHVA